MDPVLLVLAGVAAFFLFRLFSVLGTRTGHEQSHDLEPVRRQSAEIDANSSNSRTPEADEKTTPPVSTSARKLHEADPAFDETQFLAGARSAYELIVEAFAAGDLKSIRSFISDSVYDAFKSAVTAREQASQSADLKFVSIDQAGIVSSDIEGDRLYATAEFTSNQVRVTRDKDGNVIDGDPNRIDLVKDRWTFSRKYPDNDPNWILVATGGAA